MLKHIAVGIFLPYGIFLFFYIRDGLRVRSETLAILPLVLFICGAWGFVPSMIEHIPLIGPVISGSPMSNVFFFYGILHGIKTTGSTWGLGMVFFVFFSLILIFARHLGSQEKIIAELKEGGK